MSNFAFLRAEWPDLLDEAARAERVVFADPRPDTHDYNEAETRDQYIDLLLKESGWPLDQKQDREFPVTGMPNPSGNGKVDYVLWDDNGKPLGLVEAKRTSRDAVAGKQQAKLYADCLEQAYGQRPAIFFSNGYETHIWNDGPTGSSASCSSPTAGPLSHKPPTPSSSTFPACPRSTCSPRRTSTRGSSSPRTRP